MTETPSSNHGVEEMGKNNGFEIARNIKLVPPFNEADVGTYFRMFKQVAGSLGWPEESWALPM